MKLKNLFLAITIIVMHSTISKAQDSVYVNTTNDTTINQYDNMLKYFVLDKTEVKQLYKIDLFQLALKRLNFAYERKLRNNHSVELYGEFTVKLLENNYSSYYSLPTIFQFNIISDYKYYYNTNKRIRKGKNTNGFSANYLSVGLAAYMNLYNSNELYVGNNGYLYQTPGYNDTRNKIDFVGDNYPRESIYYVQAGYGLQRRIGNIGYVGAELKLGVGSNIGFTTMYIKPELNVKAGFAIKSFKRK